MAKRKRKPTKARVTKPAPRKRTPTLKSKTPSAFAVSSKRTTGDAEKKRRGKPTRQGSKERQSTRATPATRKPLSRRTKGELSPSPAGRVPRSPVSASAGGSRATLSKRRNVAATPVTRKRPRVAPRPIKEKISSPAGRPPRSSPPKETTARRSRATLSKSATAKQQAAATRKKNEREQQRRRDQRNEAARDRRAEAKAIAEAKKATQLERRRELYKINKEKQRGGGDYIPDERTIARGWLEHIRDRVAELFPVSLSVTEAGGGSAELEGGKDQPGTPGYVVSTTPWLIVGRFDPQEEIDYQTLAQALQNLSDDLPLEVSIGGQRLSQIRIVFHDPRSKRGEGDCVISRIGAWTFILGDLIGELIGSDIDDPDEGSLAGRYDQTSVPMFYVFFSSTVTRYRTVGPWAGKTQTISMKRK